MGVCGIPASRCVRYRPPLCRSEHGRRLGRSVQHLGANMARGKVGKLKASELKTKNAGLIADGGNLYLRTFEAKDGTLMRGWIFRFQLPGRNARDMGLGSLDSIGLAMARKLAAENRELVAIGVDPIERRNEIVSARRVAEAVTPAADVRSVCRRLYQDPSIRLAQSETCAAMDEYAEDLRIANHRQDAG